MSGQTSATVAVMHIEFLLGILCYGSIRHDLLGRFSRGRRLNYPFAMLL